MKKLEQKQQELNKLCEQLKSTSFEKLEQRKGFFYKIKKLEKEIKYLNLEKKVKDLNEDNRKKRELAKEFFKFLPLIDHSKVTNSGKLNKNFLKKHKDLKEFTENHSLWFRTDYGNLEAHLHYDNWKRLELDLMKYENNKKVKITDFNELLERNGIKKQDLSFEQVKKDIETAQKKSEEMLKLIEQYQNEMKELNIDYYYSKGLINNFGRKYRINDISL